MFNPRPHHQLAHYIAALNLSLVPSGSLFLSIPLRHVFAFFFLCQICFWLSIYLVYFRFPFIFTYVPLPLSVVFFSLSILIWPFSLIFCFLVFISPNVTFSSSAPLHLSLHLSLHSIPSSPPSLPPSFCKLLQLNCAFPACRPWWY